ncbi:HD domain-containing protein [Patescibacteria group bacterium]
MPYRIVGYMLSLLKKLERSVIARPAKLVLDEQVGEHAKLIKDLVRYPEVQYTKKVDHHRYHTRFDHMMLASKFAYYFARRTGADVRTCVRATAIHDVWTKGWHVQPAVDFAKKIGESQAVQNAIASHMVLNKVPRNKDQWVVAWSDECAWGVETLEFCRLYIKDFLSWVAEMSPVNVK